MNKDQLAGAVELLKALKRDLMHARRFGPDTLANYRRACSSAECDVEAWLIGHGYAKSVAQAASAQTLEQGTALLHAAADECMSPDQRNLFDSLGAHDADVYERLFRCVAKRIDASAQTLCGGAGEVAVRAKTAHRRIDALCAAADTAGAGYFDASTSMLIATQDLLTALGFPQPQAAEPKPQTDAARELIEAAKDVLANGHQHDVGGGDVFLGTCDSTERLQRALAEIERLDRAKGE